MNAEMFLAALAMKKWKQTLLDPFPLLTSFSAAPQQEFLSPFIEWATQTRRPMNWILHLDFLGWLQKRDNLNTQQITSLMQPLLVASAHRFAVTDVTSNVGVAIRWPAFGNRLVMGWKSNEPTNGCTVAIVRWPEQLPEEAVVAYLKTYDLPDAREVKWHPLAEVTL